MVAAVHDPGLAEALAVAAGRCGALVAVACPDSRMVVGLNERDRPGLVAFCTRADDAEAWHRLVAHVEQRLGPIDGLVVAPGLSWDAGRVTESVRLVVTDMRARGAGVVAWVSDGGSRAGAELPDDAWPEDPVRRVAVPRLPEPAATAAQVLAVLAGD